jgi:uncharacterized protein YjbJ (UPF0337 family)
VDAAPVAAGARSRDARGGVASHRGGMGTDDKLRNQAEKLGGQAKEAEGKLTGDESREAEGRTDQGKADLKQAGEKVKDAFR